ncbi:mannitol dehydrogenase family protein [Saccharospirillum impatiens]|uniref:mannitol dehydrogenase family protein n=1 Tax=Saccharospirillum impatiens TaxID=169438 RepID=UPI000685062A|nr:mannitol dehydrogenase family protein [Saccharospirillum impatiens]
MSELNVQAIVDITAGSCPQALHWPAFNRSDVEVGIAHIGVGGFHRAHQARYLDDLMAGSGDLHWGICGIGIRPEDKPFLETLARQKGLYTLTEKDDDQTRDRVIGSLVDVLFAPEDPQRAVDLLARPSVRIISTTITEGGYLYDFEKHRFFHDHPDVQHDLGNRVQPKTIYGYLWQALEARSKLGAGGAVTLLSCDNVPHNGDVFRKALLGFLEHADPSLGLWVQTHVSFPNSMVDRITPAPGESDQQAVLQRHGVVDPCAVGAETFIQWVIEDDFKAGRPALETVGVQFTADVSPYETAKLRLLNGSHLMMGFIGYLAGYTRVDMAIKDPAIRQLVKDYMALDAAPTLTPIQDMPLDDYQGQLIARFGNSTIADQQQRICSDGYTKLKNYLMPVLTDVIEAGGDTRRLSLLFASFLKYLDGVNDAGESMPIIEFNLSREQLHASAADRLSLLKVDALFGEHPDVRDTRFLDEVASHLAGIRARGAYAHLKLLLQG